MRLLRVGLVLGALAGVACGPADPGPASPDAGARPDAGVGDTGSSSPCPLVPSASTDSEAFGLVLDCLRDPTASASSREVAVGQFVRVVEARDGFPIVSGGRATFVYLASAAFDPEDDANSAEDFDPARRLEPLRVAGDFNGFQPASSLQSEAQGFFHLTLPMEGWASRQRYKLVAKDASGADVWFSDPLSRRFDFDVHGRISIVRGGVAQGHLEWIRSVHATRLGVDRPIWLYLPRGYDAATARYPVLYMHDGQNLFDVAQPHGAAASWDADGVAEAEIGAGRARPFMIVGIPNNANRMGEYTHLPDRPGGETVGGDGDAYGHFLFAELKPLVDRRYRTESGRASTAVLGSSLGGLISFYLGLQYPDAVKYVGGMSSTFSWGKIGLGNPTVPELYQATAGLAGRGQVYYLDSGGGPPAGGSCGSGVGRDNYCETLFMKQVLEEEGIDTFPLDPSAARIEPPETDILHWWEPDAPHFESAWNARLFRAFRLFFRP